MSVPIRDRLIREMKQSPGKSLFLAVGAIVAGFVWGPRLTASARPASAAGAAAGGPSSQLDLDADDRRDPSEIRAEFIRISEDARALRQLAEPVDAFPVEQDPFEIVSPSAPTPVASIAKPPNPDDELRKDETARAEALRLTGVFEFPRGRRAVLGGEVVVTGDEAFEFAVIEITERAVVLGGRFGTYRIAMSGSKEK